MTTFQRVQWSSVRPLAVLLVFVGIGCGSENTSTDSNEAPTRTGLRFETPAGAEVVPLDTTASVLAQIEDERLLQARTRLLQAREEWTFGTADGGESTQWGLPSDIATDADGNVFVMDRLLVALRVLSLDGKFIADIMRAGEGPLEMRGPEGLEMLRGDTLLVHSNSQLRFLTGGPDNLTYERSLVPDRSFRDLCASPDGLYLRIQSPTINASVMKIDYRGQQTLLFGEQFEHPDAGVRAQLSSGLIACGSTGRIFGSVDDAPLVFGYSSSGERQWVTEFSDFQYPVIEAVQGGVRRPRDGPNDRILTLASIPYRLVGVQVARIGAPEMVRGRRVRPIQQLDTYLLSSESGEGVYVGADLPQILHFTENMMFAVQEQEDVGYLTVKALMW